MPTNRALAATLLAVAVLALSPAAAPAQEDELDPLLWTTTVDRWISAGTEDARLTVTDVWLTPLDGFDRVTFETRGDGGAGWSIAYVDEAPDAASGPARGAAALRVALNGIAPPGDEADGADGAETFGTDLGGPAGGVILEVINDGVLEGQHTFYIAVNDRLPYRVVRLDDPKRVVIDLVHAVDPGAQPEDQPDDQVVPAGGVDAGWGGSSTTSPIGPAIALGVLLLLAVDARIMLRRSRPA
jgi:hypothetical protein